MHHVFAYGSLMFAPVWERLTIVRHRPLDAILIGYRRSGIKNANYPGIFKGNAGDRTYGKLYLDVTQNEMRNLDEFEGDLYQRVTVSVLLSELGQKIDACTYVIREDCLDVLTHQRWDPDNFESQHMQELLAEITH